MFCNFGFVTLQAAYVNDALSATESPAERAALTQHMAQKIRVCVRKRPLNSNGLLCWIFEFAWLSALLFVERRNGERDIIGSDGQTTGSLTVHEPKVKLDLTPYTESHGFLFDEAFGARTSNAAVYRQTARPLVESLFLGARATCFAYGQTGSGKTHTMLGSGGDDGLYVLAAHDVFARLAHAPAALRCHVAFFEIYGGKLFDLLAARQRLYARDNGQGEVIVRGLSEHDVGNVAQLMAIVRKGMESRSVGSTAANQDSSRSHAVLQLSIGRGESQPSVAC